MVLSKDDAIKAIERIKTQGRTWSNIYSNEALNSIEHIIDKEKAVVIMCDDHGVKRLYYCYTDEDAFYEILKSETPSCRDIVVEFITKDLRENAGILKTAGFSPIAHMMRISVKDISQSFNNSNIEAYYNTIGELPKETDAREINKILWNVFDTRVSHLQSDNEISKAIKEHEFTIHKNEEEEIDALIQSQVQPRKFYINQIYNSADKKVIHAMLQNRLREYVSQGGKYVYAWVERDNIASIKFHKKYGMEHDGMWNVVYALEKRD